MGDHYVNCWFFVNLIYHLSTRATTTLGARSKYPCPVCLVPSGRLWELSGIVYPRRTRGGVKRLIVKANLAPSAKAEKKLLNRQSVCNIPVSGFSRRPTIIRPNCAQNTFLDYFGYYTSIYEAISADPLHQIELGVFGKHIWLWVINKSDVAGYLLKGELDILDERFV